MENLSTNTSQRKASEPLISIIIPVYNVNKYLSRCLDSVFAQTYKHFECLLIDDGSTDGSAAICDEYTRRDSRFKVIHKKNGGVSAARNLGIQNAHGDWIAFVDSDDWIETDTYSTSVSAALEQNADIIIFKTINEGTNISNSKRAGKVTLDDLSVDDVEMKAIWNKLIRKNLFLKNNLQFSEGVSYSEDTFLNYIMLDKAQSIYILPNQFYHYFSRPHSLVHSISIKTIHNYVSEIEKMKMYTPCNRDFHSYFLHEHKIICKKLFFHLHNINFKMYEKIYPEMNDVILSEMKNDAYKLNCLKQVAKKHYAIANLLWRYYRFKIEFKRFVGSIHLI